MGIQHAWEDIHMSQMVANFDHLKTRGILPNVPVRKGHNGFFTDGPDVMDGLIGWHIGLSTEVRTNPTDGQLYTYLLADYDILDDDSAQKVNSGLWKSVSAEVGTWISNDEAEYWPVYQGVAYVDFSAVEGLTKFQSANGVGTKFSIMVSDKENSVTQPTPPAPQTQTPPQTPPLPPVPPQAQPGNQGGSPAASPAGDTSNHAAGQPAPQAPVQPQQPTQQNNVFTFTLSNGQTTTDFAAVQADLANLATFRKESIESARKTFVESLAAGPNPKLLATNIQATQDFALSLTNDQFEAYKKQWDAIGANPVTANHAAGATNTGEQPSGHDTPPDATPDEETILKGRVAAFRTTGMTPDQIKKTPTFARLQQLGKVPAELA